MKVCAWDIGIVNLGYCLMEDINGTLKILKLGAINILQEERITHTCCHITKKKIKKQDVDVPCTKKATFIGIKDKEYYYCKKHSTEYAKLDGCPIDDEFKKIKIKEDKLCEYVSKKPCTKKITYSDGKIGLCTTHKKSHVNKLVSSSAIKPIKKQKGAIYTDPVILAVNLMSAIDKLDCLNDILQADEILLENQPGIIAPTMKTIAGMLFAYFALRGIVEKVKNNTNVKSIKYVGAINKLKVDNDNSCKMMKTIDTSDKKKKYKLTKALGVKYAVQLLANHKDALEMLNKIEKKDDPCDALLLGYYYLYGKNSTKTDTNDNKIANKNIKDKTDVDNNENKTVVKKVKTDGNKEVVNKSIEEDTSVKKVVKKKTVKKSGIVVLC